MSSLWRVLYEEQLKLGWPGLAEEARKICDKIGLPNVNLVKTRKDDIQKAFFLGHFKDKKENIKESKKMEMIAHYDFTRSRSTCTASRLTDAVQSPE